MNCEPNARSSIGAGLSADEYTEDAFLGGQLRLRQPRRGHRSGHDAILLAAAVSAKPGERVFEFGCGAGAAGLALARRVAGLHLAMFEIDPVLADLARANAQSNGIAAKVHVLDVCASTQAFASAGLGQDSTDHVMMNPPFNDASRHQASPDVKRALAHVADEHAMGGWIDAARRVLKPRGVLTAIWRPESLPEALAMLGRGFGGICILPVYSKPDSPAIRVLVSAIKGSRGPVKIRPGLMLMTLSGSPVPEAQAVLSGGPISLATNAA